MRSVLLVALLQLAMAGQALGLSRRSFRRLCPRNRNDA